MSDNSPKGLSILNDILKQGTPTVGMTPVDAPRISEEEELNLSASMALEAVSEEMWKTLAGRFEAVTGRTTVKPSDVFPLLRNTLTGMNHVTNNLAALVHALNTPEIKKDLHTLINHPTLFLYGLFILLDRHQDTALKFAELTGAPRERPE